MDYTIGKIIKALAIILLVLAIIGGLLLLLGINTALFDVYGMHYNGVGWAAAVSLWISGFIGFVFLYAFGVIVESIVAIRMRVDTIGEASTRLDKTVSTFSGAEYKPDNRRDEVVIIDETDRTL